MSKKIIKVEEQSKEFQLEQVKNAVGGNCACFVLITCTHPSSEGKMEVEMHYEGDESLAAFLVENAGQVFDGKLNQRESK